MIINRRNEVDAPFPCIYEDYGINYFMNLHVQKFTGGQFDLITRTVDPVTNKLRYV